MKSRLRVLGSLVAVLVLVSLFAAADSIIDIEGPYGPPPPPASGDPWHSLWDQPVITYVFDGEGWTEQEKAVARFALSNLDDNLLDNTLEEEGDFSIRWAGPEIFKNWRTEPGYDLPGWDLSKALAIAYKHGNGPWDQDTYPNDEIYFNTKYKWSFSLWGVDPKGYDFWTVLMHESIHMLACDDHAQHPNEVMYKSIGMGQRKWLKQTDLDILIGGGYRVPPAPIEPVPEPATLLLLGTGLVGVTRFVRRRKAIARVWR